MAIDDITFSRFVNNDLSYSEMLMAEESLMACGEVDAVIQASILNYAVNAVMADDMLGIDSENEEFSVLKDRNNAGADSKEQKSNLSTTSMKTNFSKEELQTIQQISDSITVSINPEIPFEENLMNIYIEQRPGSFPEEAQDIVSRIRGSIEKFIANLQQAMSEVGFDYVSELKKVSSEMNLQEKYELYINFLAALQTMSINNLSPEQMSQIENFQTVRERLFVNGDVTEDMLADVERQIAAMLQNNTFCMGSIETVKTLISELPKGSDAIENIILGSEKDIMTKMIAALAAYIAYRNGQIESLVGQEMSPEEIAISVSAGMEEMKVMNDLTAGRTTVDKAIKILKIIGGVALFSILAYFAVSGIIAIGAMTAVMFSMIFGTSTIAAIGALLIGGLVTWSLIDSALTVGDKMLNWSSRMFDMVIECWRETAWPAVKRALQSGLNWFFSLFHSDIIMKQEQNNDPQVVSAM